MADKNEAMNLINQARAQARNEKLAKFFSDHSTTIMRLIVALVVVIIAAVIFTMVQTSREEKFSAIMHQSLIDQQVGDIAKAKENLKKIYETKSAPSGVRSLASLRYAGFLLEEGQKPQAAKIYEEIHKCHTCDSYISDLAGLLTVKTWVSDETEMQKADLPERIEKIEKSSKILKYYIAEQRALVEMQRNNLEKSYQIFEMIAKKAEGSENLQNRAAEEMKMVIAKGYEPKTDLKEEVKK